TSVSSVDWPKLRRFQATIRRSLHHSTDRQWLEGLLVRYARSLDERIMETSYIKLWTLLEVMTETSRESYDVTIRRTAALFRDRDFHLLVLRQLKDERNRIVHAHESPDRIEELVYRLK